MRALAAWPGYASSAAALGLLALLVSAAAWHGAPAQQWEEPLLFVALATAALVFPVPAAPGRSFTLMPAVAAAAVLLFPPPLALLVVGTGSLIGNLILVASDQRERRAAASDVGQTLLGMAVAAAVLSVTLSRLPAVAALLLAATAMYLAETFTAAVAVALRRGGAVLLHWQRSCREAFLPAFALYLAGLALGLAAIHHPRATGLALLAAAEHPWVVVVVAVPVALLYLSLQRTVALAAALRSANEALEALIQAAPLAIVVHDRAGRVTVWNPAASRLLGWEKEEVLGGPSPAIPEAARRQFFAQLDAALRGRAHQPAEAWWRRKDGSGLAVALWMAPLRGAGGKRTGAMTIITDITEQREAAARQRFVARASSLLASSLEYEVTLEHVLDLAVPGLADWCAIDSVGPDGGAARLACRPEAPGSALALPADLPAFALTTIRTGQRQLATVAPEPTSTGDAGGRDGHAPAATGLLCLPLRVRGQTVGALTLAAKGGEERFAGAGAALAEELAGRAALAIEHARLYREAQEATGRAQAAVRARDEFMSIAAHELKTPLAALSGFSELAEEQLAAAPAPDPARARRSVAAVRRQADRLSRLVQQLLDVTRLETGRLRLDRRPTDLVRLVAEAVEAAPASHRWSLQAPPALWATVDPLRCEQVLTNLLSNAGKYSPEGSAVDVEVAQPDPGAVRVSVRDRGPGVPAEQRAHLFERFYRAQPDGTIPGMGLGLYVSRQIAEAHGGTLRAEFPPDGGSCFILTLPDAPEQRQAAAAPARPGAA